MARHLITSAIPYINGIKHLGNLVGSQLPADLYARYLRQRGHEVLFLCATDEHGTPAELAAAKAGKPVADYCAEMHDVQAKIADGFGLSFDHFGRSSSAQNHALTQHFAGALASQGLIKEVSETQIYSQADGRFCQIATSKAPAPIAALKMRAAINATIAQNSSTRPT
jgi:methionyl-tRNA synthetase